MEEFEEKYENKRMLSKGHFGTLYVVTDKTKNEFAAKIIKCRKKADFQKVEEEIEILKELNHPKLLKLMESFTLKDKIIIITELVAGGELFERVVSDDVDLTEDDCRDFLSQILLGVQFMHSKSIAHFDLKPENILCISHDSRLIKLIDFGLSKRLTKGLEYKMMFGTVDYLAPEVVNYDPVSLATDMWAVGVITYILLSGLTPFGGDTDTETYNNISNGNFDFEDEAFDEISEEAKNFISALLVHSQKSRLTASQAMEHIWLSDEKKETKTVIKKDNLRTFNTKRKWNKTANAIKAISRLSHMGKFEDNKTSIEVQETKESE